jgi:MAF protein
MLDLAAPFVLASGSPRRRELLAGAGLRFVVRPAGIDETPLPGEAPANYVRRLSIEKTDASMASPLANPAEIVLAADTTVDVTGEIFEKPLDTNDAYRMLRMLSGRSHLVHTGVTVSVPIAGACRSSTIVVTTEVTFADLEDAAIDWYPPRARQWTKPAHTASKVLPAPSSRRLRAASPTSLVCPSPRRSRCSVPPRRLEQLKNFW